MPHARRASAGASITQLPFLHGQFDLVTSFDVLCERAVPDDVAALREIRRVLVPTGRVVLRLPAYDWLRGQHDRAVHTQRRYTARAVAARLADAGLAVDHLSYANAALFPVAAAKRWFERVILPRDGTSDLTLGVGPFNGLLRRILGAEAWCVARSELPYGLTVVAVGRRA